MQAKQSVSTARVVEGAAINGGNLNLKPIRTKKKDDHNGEEEEGEEALLSPTSRMFHEPNYNIYVIAIMGWKGPVRLDVVRDNLANTMLRNPRFSSLQVVDSKDRAKIRWVPTEVNLDDHIIVPDLDPDIDSPDEFVDNFISNLSRSSIDMSKPLWDLHILNLKTSDADVVSIFRFHHSLGDGISLVSTLLSSTRKTSDPNSLPTFPKPKKRVAHGKAGLWHYFVKLWLLLRKFANTMVDLLMFIATSMFLKDTQTPIISPPGPAPAPVRYFRRTVSLDDIKFVKNATNATVNDVILGIIQAGLTRYLNRRYGDETKKGQRMIEKRSMIPKGIRCRATVLVNLRPHLTINALSEEREKDGSVETEGNCFGFVLFPLNIFMVDNPLDHVHQVKTMMDRKKQSYEVVCTTHILNFILKLFGFKEATVLAHRIPTQTTLAFSNVMGPVEEISYCGHPMTFLAATCYGQPNAMMIHAVSYTNKLTFAISVDERTIPDPYQLGDDIVESLQLMKTSILEKNKSKSD